jgi:FNIP Repeat
MSFLDPEEKTMSIQQEPKADSFLVLPEDIRRLIMYYLSRSDVMIFMCLNKIYYLDKVLLSSYMGFLKYSDYLSLLEVRKGRESDQLRFKKLIRSLHCFEDDNPNAVELLPSNLLELSVSFDADYIDTSKLPITLRTLAFGCYVRSCCNYGADHAEYQYEVDIRSLPPNLTSILFPFGYLYPFQTPFPSSITRIDIPFGYLPEIPPHVLPENLIDLIMDSNFPLLKGVLPASLQHLSLGVLYNHQLTEGILPFSLRTLDLGGCNLPLEPNVLPPLLEVLKFGFDEGMNDFNHPFLLGVFPKSLTSLYLSRAYNHAFEVGVLPPFLTTLSFGKEYNHALRTGVLPPNLERLYFCDDSDFNHPITEAGILPLSLKTLRLGNLFCSSLLYLPPGLISLTLGHRAGKFNLDITLPPTLEELNLPFRYSCPTIQHTLTTLSSLTHICISERLIYQFLNTNYLPLLTNICIFSEVTNLNFDPCWFPQRENCNIQFICDN